MQLHTRFLGNLEMAHNVPATRDVYGEGVKVRGSFVYCWSRWRTSLEDEAFLEVFEGCSSSGTFIPLVQHRCVCLGRTT